MTLARTLTGLVVATALSSPAFARTIPLVRGQADFIYSASTPLPAAPATIASSASSSLELPIASSPPPTSSPPVSSSPATSSPFSYPQFSDAFVLGASPYTTADSLLAADGALISLGGYHKDGSLRGTFTLFGGAVRSRDVPFTWTAFGATADVSGLAARLAIDTSGLAGYRTADASPFVALTTSWDGAAGTVAGVRTSGFCRGLRTLDDFEAFGCRGDLSGVVRMPISEVTLDLFAGGGVHVDRSLFGSQEVPAYLTSGFFFSRAYTRLTAAFYLGEEVGGTVAVQQIVPYVRFFAAADGFFHNGLGVSGIRGRAGVEFFVPTK